MTVRKRGNVYWVDFAFNGKRYRKPSPDRTRKGALVYESILRQRLACGDSLEKPKAIKKITFEDLARKWFEVYVKNNCKPSEIRNREYVLNATLIPYFGPKHINEINSYDIEQFKNLILTKKKVSPKTINNYLCLLSRCLKTAVDWQMLENIPKLKLLKIAPQKYDYLTESESEKLLQNAQGDLYDMMLLAVRTGLRFGELIALKWEDIDLEKAILTVNRNISIDIEGSPKNNKSRTVPLASSVVKMLEDRKRDVEYIFHDNKGHPLTYNKCRYRLGKLCKKAAMRRIGWHTLRHSFASHLAARRNSVIAIKELLGHSDVKTTMRYAHVNLPVLQSAIETLEPLGEVGHNNVTFSNVIN